MFRIQTTSLFIVIIISLSAHCQIERGTWMVGGILHPIPNYDIYLRSDLSLSYFAFKNTSIGLRHQSDSKITFRSYRSFNNEASLFFRYYIPISKRFSLFAETSGSFGKNLIFQDNTKCIEDIYQISTSLGATYWATSWLNVEGRLNNNWRWYTGECRYESEVSNSISSRSYRASDRMLDANLSVNLLFTRLLELKRRQ